MDMKNAFAGFIDRYSASEKDKIWAEQSVKVRTFWSQRINTPGTPDLTEEEMDPILRILDKHAKGNTPDMESVARVMIPQGAWYRMLRNLKKHDDLRDVMDQILNAENDDARANAIDKLYLMNAGRIKYLTGESGNAVGAFLFACQPQQHLSMLSLNDRSQLFRYLEIDFPFNNASIGTRIVKSNKTILEHLRGLFGDFSPRTLCNFLYTPELKSEWKGAHSIRNAQGESVDIAIPENDREEECVSADSLRESMRIQAAIARIGEAMGFTVWLPKSDRSRVLTAWSPAEGVLLDRLPLNYDGSTNKTIENIDVIWLSRNMIVRLFEVEHTTSIYSGILRMADLLSLQPNLDIRMHIVAPSEKQDKVLDEIRRPVFANLQAGPLMKKCTYIPYENIEDLESKDGLKYMKIDVMNEYEITAE